jgi:hypothetical protein
MLAVSPDHNLIADAWEAADMTVQLPESLGPFLESRGPMPLYHENKRCFHRHYMRGKAILKRGEMTLGTFTKDVSRQTLVFVAGAIAAAGTCRLLLPNGSKGALGDAVSPRGLRIALMRGQVRSVIKPPLPPGRGPR